MPSLPALLTVMMMIIYGGVEVVKCLEMFENDPENVDREIRTLCSLNPTFNICAELPKLLINER
ncbi:unnamed protein product [Brugia pahangi]|uniref:Saposin B-type domain-containing protein n=1 Tax=Brugia pahangi TaxID=6280 RepID=A0A0N4TAV4_BRUPA|nr:unnamed protein product [Brugia pahangi]